ncbi:hypothetical protein EV175_002254 [Coemansia sp. RSA 1933]|nr:hypothetical protein EV175_002254 [Coemansia sp. RSA 1933]
MPFSVGMNGWIGWENIDAISLPLPAFRHDYAISPVGFPKPTISNIHISDTTQDRISLELVFEVKNPFRYGAYMSDIAFMLRYSGLHIATVSLREPALNRGQNTVTSFVDFYNHASDPRQQAFFLQASSGRNLTIEIAGFPNCTSITPLEASLRDFSREIVVDTSKFKSGGDSASSGVQSVLREVVLHAFDMSAEATIVNPVSGADIWLQSIEAIGYYDGGISLGSMDYDFTLDHGLLARSRNSSAIVATRYPSNGLLLPPKTATTTPRMPVTANKTSIGWDVVRRAIGGTLDVDVFTSVQLLVGSAYLNLTVMGKNAPVKIRL